MTIDILALSLVAERAKEAVETALPYIALIATFAFIVGIAAGIVH